MYATWTADENELCDKYVNPLKKVGADLSPGVIQSYTSRLSGGGAVRRGNEFATAVQACVADDAPGGEDDLTIDEVGSPAVTGTVSGDSDGNN